MLWILPNEQIVWSSFTMQALRDLVYERVMAITEADNGTICTTRIARADVMDLAVLWPRRHTDLEALLANPAVWKI